MLLVTPASNFLHFSQHACGEEAYRNIFFLWGKKEKLIMRGQRKKSIKGFNEKFGTIYKGIIKFE